MRRAVAPRYALALACTVLAVLVHLSPAGSLFPFGGLFFLAVVGAAWFGGAGPGLLAAALGALALPQLITVNHTVLGGVLDLPRFVTFSVAGLAVGWWSFRRRQTEAALRESEKRFRSLTELSNDFYWETDAAHRYTVLDFGLIHRGAHEKWKKLGKTPWEIPSTSPDEAGWAALRATIDERKPFTDFAVSRFDRGEERCYEISGEPRFAADGTFLGYRGVGRETTARVHAEHAFRQSQESYALAVDATGAGHWDWKIPTDEFYASPRHLEIGGFARDVKFASRAEFAERYPFHPEDRPKWQAAMDAHFSGETPRIDIEVRILPRAETRWVRMIGQVQRDHLGRPLRYAGVSIDATEAKLAEQALRVSEERHARAMEASAAGHWDWNMLTDELFVSQRAQEMLDLPPGRLPPTRTEFLSLMSKYRADMDEGVAASLESGTFDRVYRVVPQSGPVRWLNSRGKVYKDDAGTPVRMTGSLTDITERKLAEEALRESEARYERVVAATEAGFWDWDIAQDKYYVSPRLLEMAGLPPDTVIADRAGFMARVPLHREDLARWQREMQALFASGESRLSTEVRVMLATGTRWVRLDGKCFRDAVGKVLRWTGSAIDVTPRKIAEEALRKSEERYELAMAASESGYWDWDIPAGRYFASPRAIELAGFPPGTTWVSRDEYRAAINMHPEDFARWEAAREALFAGKGERLSMEVRYMVRGESRWHILHAICKRDEAGKVVRWSGSATDITERKQAEEELQGMERKLRQSQRLEAMGTLAGGIAHDFNNILGGILAYGEMGLRDAPKGSRLARDLSKIMTAGERGRALIDRVLTFSRGAAGELQPVQVEQVVREALDLIMAKLPPNVAVHPKLHAAGAAVLADATQVHQLVTNLATNAIHAMPAGGTLRVALAVERVDTPRAATIGGRGTGEYVVLTVADTGSGIAPEILDRIFDPYFTTKDVGTGTGLGLSLVHGIVTGLGGTIDVATALGSGSTFTIYLPRYGDAVEPRDERESAPPRGDGQRVLIVDDEEALVEHATRTLEALGYVPTGFTSSTAALAAFRAEPERFDAVITDERMPGVSGSSLIREVRGIRGRVPIVLMSGYLGGGLAERAREAGADEVLKKPLSAHEMAAGLARVLRKSGHRRISQGLGPTTARRS